MSSFASFIRGGSSKPTSPNAAPVVEELPDFAQYVPSDDAPAPASSPAAVGDELSLTKLAALQARLGPRFPLRSKAQVLQDGMLWQHSGDDVHPCSNVREVTLTSDAVIIIKQEGRAQISGTELSIAGATLRDRVHLAARARGAAAPTVADSFEIVTSTGSSIILVAPDASTKAVWFAALAAAICACVPYEARMERGWMHHVVTGTLYAAAIAGDAAAVRDICAHLRDSGDLHERVNAADDEGRTPLHYAAMLGHADVVSELLSAGASQESVDTDSFSTPLHLAIAGIALTRACIDAVVVLLHNSPPLLAKDIHDRTPLALALSSSLPAEDVARLVELLRGACAGDASTSTMLMRATDKDGYSAVHAAVRGGYADAIQPLVRAGADVNAFTATTTRAITPLHLACGAVVEEGAQPVDLNVDCIVALLRLGAQPNMRTHTEQRSSPLHLLLERAQAAKRTGASPHDVAVCLSAAAQLSSFGARLDVVDGAGAPARNTAEALGTRAALETAGGAFASRAPPADAALGALALERSAAGPFVTKRVKAGLGVAKDATQWAADTSSAACTLCGGAFTLFSRRHHCRQCGALVCHACSSKTFPLSTGRDSDDDTPSAGARSPAGGMAPERVCDGCFTRLAHLGELALREERAAAESRAATLRVAEASRPPAMSSSAAGAPDARAKLFGDRGGAAAASSAPARAGPPAVAGQIGELQSTLRDVGVKLDQRGEKLSRIDERSKQMADSAASFADLASQLKAKNKSWF